MEETKNSICPECGEVYFTADVNYIRQHPTGYEVGREQAFDRHVSGECPNSAEYDTVILCDDCEEELGRWDREYCTRYPTGLSIAIDQAREEHEWFCQGAANG